MSINPTTAGIQAFLAAQQRLNVSATKIAEASIQNNVASITEPLLDLTLAEQQAKAAARVIETENDTLGALLNIKV